MCVSKVSQMWKNPWESVQISVKILWVMSKQDRCRGSNQFVTSSKYSSWIWAWSLNHLLLNGQRFICIIKTHFRILIFQQNFKHLFFVLDMFCVGVPSMRCSIPSLKVWCSSLLLHRRINFVLKGKNLVLPKFGLISFDRLWMLTNLTWFSNVLFVAVERQKGKIASFWS